MKWFNMIRKPAYKSYNILEAFLVTFAAVLKFQRKHRKASRLPLKLLGRRQVPGVLDL